MHLAGPPARGVQPGAVPVTCDHTAHEAASIEHHEDADDNKCGRRAYAPSGRSPERPERARSGRRSWLALMPASPPALALPGRGNLDRERWLIGRGQTQYGAGNRGRRADPRLQRPQPDGEMGLGVIAGEVDVADHRAHPRPDD